MRMLVFGGTIFVSKAVAAEAVRRGHDVVCAARGTSGAVPDGATLLRIDRDAPDALADLVGERFEAVVDTSIMSYTWVTDALAALRATAEHWTFVSSISVYADEITPGQRPGAPVVEPRAAHGTLTDRDADPGLYGAVKVASENAVRDALDDLALIVRPGLITGPGDGSDRFGYWPARFARGGRAVVPDVEQEIQYIDVRDLASWIVTGAEQRVTGTFDAVGPRWQLRDLLAAIASGFDAELAPVPPDQLVGAGVGPWVGPRTLPLWLPPEAAGIAAHDPEPARQAGLRTRPLDDAVAGALAHERALGLDRPRRAGLTPAEEAEILAAVAENP
ncbi:NAD-dependent epimerase/dehydratase family protein [Haloechinothrix salitolerans]|uniref:NAD-dependent epimerase/dehydratase family protein n=1 Tax=Haloechinothrix salitolerans TaxID=926830 RepID=A0ABW2BS83_9PSEU